MDTSPSLQLHRNFYIENFKFKISLIDMETDDCEVLAPFCWLTFRPEQVSNCSITVRFKEQITQGLMEKSNSLANWDAIFVDNC